MSCSRIRSRDDGGDIVTDGIVVAGELVVGDNGLRSATRTVGVMDLGTVGDGEAEAVVFAVIQLFQSQ